MSEFISQAQDVGFDLMQVLGGLAIFLFGIKTMGDTLKLIAGSRMKELIDKSTSSPFRGVLVGAAVTGLLQSSSATTALAISLVRAGLMTLRQAVGIIMGANIGTTITAILIGFKLGEYAEYILIVGAVILMFSKKIKTHHIGLLIFSFGGLFYGLEIMGSGLKVLAEMPIFTEFAITLSDNKFYGILLGLMMTLLIQSSSATIGILQSLYSDGLLTLEAALPVLFGDNIGTTITAVLASIGGSVAARRAAAAHVLFNVIGTIIFMLIFGLFYNYVVWGAEQFNLEPAMQIAFAHASFNITTTIILFPFIGVLVYIVEHLIKDKNADDELKSIILDEQLIYVSPQDAVTAAYANAVEMATLCYKMNSSVRKYVFEKDAKSHDKIALMEDLVNGYNKSIGKYLVKVGENELDERYTKLQTDLIYSIKDLERVGDHYTNLIEIFDEIYGSKEVLTEQAMIDLTMLFDLVDSMLENTIKTLDNFDENSIEKIISTENILDEYTLSSKDRFVERYKRGELLGEIGATLFMDILSELERVGDHCQNIAVRAKRLNMSRLD